MGRKKDLLKAEKEQIVRELGNGRDTCEISKLLRRDHRTIQKFVNEGKSERKKRPKGFFSGVTERDLRKLKLLISKNPHKSSKWIFEAAGLPNVSKSARCKILNSMGEVKKRLVQSPINEKQRKKRMDWAIENLKTNFSQVVFTDEARAILDGPDGWDKGWVVDDQEPQSRFRRQQGGGGVMFWVGIIGNTLIGPVRVPDGVKVNSEQYCILLEEAFIPWLDKLSPTKKKQLIFQQDNAPSHSSRYTKAWLGNKGIKGKNLMVWPPNSADLNPIENLWSIMKRRIYQEGKQYSSKETLWQAIKEVWEGIEPEIILSLTSSMDKRLMELLQKEGKHIKR